MNPILFQRNITIIYYTNIYSLYGKYFIKFTWQLIQPWFRMQANCTISGREMLHGNSPTQKMRSGIYPFACFWTYLDIICVGFYLSSIYIQLLTCSIVHLVLAGCLATIPWQKFQFFPYSGVSVAKQRIPNLLCVFLTREFQLISITWWFKVKC